MKLNARKYFTSILVCSLLILISSCGSDDDGDVPKNDIVIKSISPDSPASLDHYGVSSNDRVTIEYEYNITHDEGARIWIIPYTDGDQSPGYRYSQSDVYKGKGSKKVSVSIAKEGGKVNVDQLEISIANPDQSETIRERYIDVDYTFE